jgi:hypothetical protein
VAIVLAVEVSVVKVVDVVLVNDGEMAAVRAVRVVVGLSGTVLERGGHVNLLVLTMAQRRAAALLIRENHKSERAECQT